MRPIYILLALAIYVPFEDGFLFMMHLGPTLLAAAKSIPEIVIYATLAVVLAVRQMKGERIAVGSVESTILVFFISALATTYLYGGNLLNAAINLKALFRYYCLTVIALNSRFTDRDLQLLIKATVLGAVFQALLSIACVLSPLGVFFHLLRQSNGSIDEKVGSQFGTFATAASGSLFYLVAISFVISKAYKPKIFNPTFVRWFFMALIMVGIAITMKRAALLAAVAAYLTLLVIDKKRVRAGVLAFGGAMAAGGMILLAATLGTTAIKASDIRSSSVSTLSFATELFTSDYWQKSEEDSRGWILTDVFPNLILSPRVTGFGADPDEAKILFVSDNPGLSHLIDYSALEDVYWAAVLLYYGTLGALMLLWVLLKFAMRIWLGRRYLTSTFQKEISSTTIMLILISIMYAFVVRVFELRAFTFYFWLFIGVAVQQYREAKRAWFVSRDVVPVQPAGVRALVAPREIPPLGHAGGTTA